MSLTNCSCSVKDSYQDKIFEILMKYFYSEMDNQRIEFKNNPDMSFKLNVHYPQVLRVAEKMEPNNKVLHLAAAYHDWGRAIQFRQNGNFNDHEMGSEYDHHVIGYRDFLAIAPNILEEEVPLPVIESAQTPCGMLYPVSQAILLHGLRDKALEKEFQKLEFQPKVKKIVDAVSTIDNIANGVQCVGYLLREGQEKQKNTSKGGFIPDENQDLKTVTPKVMEIFRQSEAFNRNVECKTYPDYYVFGCFLATRSLKNPVTREIAKGLMDEPISIWSYDDNKNLISQRFENGLEAFNHLFKTTMIEEDASQASKILHDYYHFGKVRD